MRTSRRERGSVRWIALLVLAAAARPALVAPHPARAATGEAPAIRHGIGPSLKADFNGDGFADLAVGARYEDVGTKSNAGSVNVLYGSSAGLQATGTGGPDDQFWTQDSAGMQDQADPGDKYGQSIAAADWNADGFADLAFGGMGEDLGSIANAGAVVVLYATSAGLQADAPDDQFWNQDSPGVEDQAEQLDGFAWSLTGTTS